MKLVAAIKLLPDAAQAAALKATLERGNAACNGLAETGHKAGKLRQYDLPKRADREGRERFALTAQAVVRCIAKVADADQVNRKVGPRFSKLAAQP